VSNLRLISVEPKIDQCRISDDYALIQFPIIQIEIAKIENFM